MKHSYIIGIDAGTTNIKSVLYDLTGEELYVSAVDNIVLSEGSHSEQDMHDLEKNVYASLKMLLDNSGINRKNVLAIGVTGQGEGLWCLDKDNNPINNAILWNDSRALSVVESIQNDGNLYTEIKRDIASFIKPGSTLSLIKWIKEHDIDRYNSIGTIFSCKDWIRYSLTGEIYWEMSDATCSCVNFHTNDYAFNVFKKLDVADMAEKLPPLITATEYAGTLKEEVAKSLGLNNDVKVSGGMLDIVSSAAGSGAMEINDVVIILGTTGMTLSILNKYTADDKFNGWETYLTKDMYVKGMGTMAATPNLDWAIDQLFDANENIYGLIDEYTMKYKPFESKLLYHPHISLSGERAPFFDPYASASFLGIKTDTTRYDMVHAIMEGVALSIKDCLIDVKNIEKVYLTGGGAKSNIWPQIIANVLNCDVYISDSSELGAKGAAISAGLMLQNFDGYPQLSDNFCKIKRIFTPITNYVEDYRKLYKIYKRVQGNVKDFWYFKI